MTRRLRIISFLSAMACFAGAASISYLGFELWPPSATLADGRSVAFGPADIEACIRGRGLAWLGDRSGDATWRACRSSLSQYPGLSEQLGIIISSWFYRRCSTITLFVVTVLESLSDACSLR
jgi:hypothetical protein